MCTSLGASPVAALTELLYALSAYGELNIPGSLLFVADHGEYKGHGVVDTLDAAVGVRVVGTGGNLIDAEAVVKGEGKVGAKLKSVVGK